MVHVWTRNKSGTQRLAPCLLALFEQADARWPNRAWASDGTLGDASHSARASDHNPGDDETDEDDTRWVCAGDLTDNDPNPPVAWKLVEHLRSTRDSRVKYLISEGKAAYAYAKPGRPAWTWVKYTGPNGHFKHAHISVWNTAAARNDLRPWFPPQEGNSNANPPEDDDMADANIIEAAKLEAVAGWYGLFLNVEGFKVDPKGAKFWLEECDKKAAHLVRRDFVAVVPLFKS